jgi:phosphoglycolate phosphatase-like HAD superfamily hydrolase
VNKLILWDVDGTLLYGGGVSGEIMRAAMRQVYGSDPTAARVVYAGKTDQQIILDTFPDQPAEQLMGMLDTFMQAYVAEFNARKAEFLTRGRVLDGVTAALERLAGATVIQSLLTGNVQPIARLKLETLGIDHFVDFSVGAYGSDHHRRVELVPLAQARAEARYGRRFIGQDVVIIGDTPHDIECGKAAGARTVAVASGPFAIEELRAHTPDIALKSLVDTDVVIEAILG